MSLYHLRPLRLADARYIKQQEILGTWTSVGACRDDLRQRLLLQDQKDVRYWVFVSPNNIPLFYLIDHPGSPETRVRQITLQRPKGLSLSEEARRVFEREVYHYLSRQSASTAAYLLLGEGDDLLEGLPVKSVGTLPLAEFRGGQLQDVSLNLLDLANFSPKTYAACGTDFGLVLLVADGNKLKEVELLPKGAPVRDFQARRWGQAVGFLNDRGQVTNEGCWVQETASAILREASEQLVAYLQGDRQTFDLPLDPEGTPFQKSVWQAIRAVPYGESVSYLDISRAISRSEEEARNRARAVGGACGANPLPIFIPCHRILSSDGKLHGFSSGLEIKAALLDRELIHRLTT